MIEKIDMYKAEDGKLFFSEIEAKEYQFKQDSIKYLSSFFDKKGWRDQYSCNEDIAEEILEAFNVVPK